VSVTHNETYGFNGQFYTLTIVQKLLQNSPIVTVKMVTNQIVTEVPEELTHAQKLALIHRIRKFLKNLVRVGQLKEEPVLDDKRRNVILTYKLKYGLTSTDADAETSTAKNNKPNRAQTSKGSFF